MSYVPPKFDDRTVCTLLACVLGMFAKRGYTAAEVQAIFSPHTIAEGLKIMTPKPQEIDK